MPASLVSMALGALRFAILAATYQRLRHQAEERWVAVDRAGAEQALQFAGHGPRTLRVEGAIFPALTGTMRIPQAMRLEAARGEPMLLIDGLGFYWGRWALARVDEETSLHMADGAPRRQGYNLTLQRYGAGPIEGLLS